MSQTNLREINIRDKTDRLIVWNNKRWKFHQRVKEWCGPIYQFEEKEYDPQTERLWIYVNSPENKLMYVLRAIKHEGKVWENPNCNTEGCCESSREYNEGKIKSYVSNEVCKFAYKLYLLHEFEKGNSLQELVKYKHEKSGKPFQPPQKFVYVSSYPELVKDIVTGKIS